MVLLVGTIAFGVAFAVARLLVYRFGRFVLDEPTTRSLHSRPVPRTGGIAVLIGTAVALVVGAAGLSMLLGPALILALVSFADDLWRLPLAARLGVHAAAAGVAAWYLLSPIHPLQLGLIIAGIIWMTNLYNFMDGSDGLAGGMGVIGFGTYAAACWIVGDAGLTLACLALSASCAGFLVYNVHPARLFLGDVGSIPLGFLAGAVGILGWREDLWPLWFPVLVFGPFIADATITLIRRAVRGERIWQAHRSHYYQRMVLMGLGHRGTAHVLYGLMLVCAACALLGRNGAPYVQAGAFFSAAAALAAAAVWVDMRWARFVRSEGKAA